MEIGSIRLVVTHLWVCCRALALGEFEDEGDEEEDEDMEVGTEVSREIRLPHHIRSWSLSMLFSVHGCLLTRVVDPRKFFGLGFFCTFHIVGSGFFNL